VTRENRDDESEERFERMLAECAKEPIHVPGTVQNHGILFALDHNWVVTHVSENADLLQGIPASDQLGASFLHLFKGYEQELLEPLSHISEEGHLISLDTVSIAIGGSITQYSAAAHRYHEKLIVEFERVEDQVLTSSEDVYALLPTFVNRLEWAATVSDLYQMTAEEVKRITGFHRVLIYKFDEKWNGTVVGEARSEDFPSYFDLRFPASDIPEQARRLYSINRFRLIADAGSESVAIMGLATEGKTLDLTHSILRSVSPVHIQYLKNMGITASMSVSIMQGDRLWGLISCHHKVAKKVSVNARIVCDLLGRLFSQHLRALEERSVLIQKLTLKSGYDAVIRSMSEESDFVGTLLRYSDRMMELFEAHGFAVVLDGKCALRGLTPTEDEVRALVESLSVTGDPDVYTTDSIRSSFPDGERYSAIASGVLAISISHIHKSYVLWFRPEVIQTVKWGGDPKKPVVMDPPQSRLQPRASFELWKETVTGKSLPWSESEVEATRDLRHGIVDVVLRRAEELASLSIELERSNRELEAFSYSVSHDLRAPFRHIISYAELLEEESDIQSERSRRFISTIIASARQAGNLVDSLLAFSQMGRGSLMRTSVDMNEMVQEVREDVMRDAIGRTIEWRISSLPTVDADVMMLRLAIRNLLANAVKFTSKRKDALIEIGWEERDSEHLFFVRDNGVGFDMAFEDKLFGVFQRLHSTEEFEGTGIGLANVRRIVSRHGGRTWGWGEVDKGAAFFFTLPR